VEAKVKHYFAQGRGTYGTRRINLNVAGKSCPVPKHTEKQ
jgi:hypothetical protein